MTYSYKGYKIEKVADKQWHILKNGVILDATSTLSEAKQLISKW